MRFSTSSFVVLAGLGAGLGGFWGCTGDVSTVTGGTGGGGGHTTTGTTGTTMSTTGANMTTTATSASSSSGGNTPCDMGCAHAAMCGFDLCKMFNINCSTVGNQYDCFANCIAMAPCMQLQQAALACYQGCMNPDGGGGTDGGSPAQCQMCAGTQCGSAVQACFQDMASGCNAWLQCSGACFNAADPNQCEDACDNMYPNAKAEYGAIYSCTCTNCNSECAGGDPCAHVPDGGP